MRNLPLYIRRIEARWGHSGYLTAHQCEAFSLVGLQFFFLMAIRWFQQLQILPSYIKTSKGRTRTKPLSYDPF